jgi:hypothetical protein
MNPGGGYIDSDTLWGEYLAARQGGDDCLHLVPPATPTPKPPTPPKEEDDMWLLTNGGDPTGHVGQYVFTGAAYVPMNDPADVLVLVANGNLASATPKVITPAQHATYRKVGAAPAGSFASKE